MCFELVATVTALFVGQRDEGMYICTSVTYGELLLYQFYNTEGLLIHVEY